MARIKTLSISTFILALSVVLVSLSVFIPVTIRSRIELQQVRLGLPLYFIIQSQVGLPLGFPDSQPFPAPQAFLSPWEHPFQIIWWRYFLNITMVLAALNLVYLAHRFLQRRAWPGK